MEEISKIYPLTIVADRYGGSYSGALFTAWNLQYDQLPNEISDCDLGCGIFWTKADRSEIGFGNNPNEAYQNLLEKLQVKKLKEQEALERKLKNLRHLTQEEFCENIKRQGIFHNGETAVVIRTDEGESVVCLPWAIFELILRELGYDTDVDAAIKEWSKKAETK